MSTPHRPHPISGPWPAGDDAELYMDPDDAVLYDGCPRCEQHAGHPLLSLDPDTLGRLWARMVQVEKVDPNHGYYRSRNEALAGRQLYMIAVAIERTHRTVDPWRWPWVDRSSGRSLDGALQIVNE